MVRRSSETPAFTVVGDALRALSDTVAGVEDDLFSSLVVMGETEAQQAVDGWVDQLVDLLRSVDEVTVQHRATLARASARRGLPDQAGTDAFERAPSPVENGNPWERR